ncbi:hypothetical protein ACYFX5_15330 [Bremerella sp. T1]|uniref:hypothetical protein n=1 Tax=Bremerella sp. TYQ1 TaxID=3119568 RepID=UPI001CC9933F|nr:hypothetical protein [Bremerella volcania]UBM34429.1 hypothetical protein LA756_17280 [Bremerella volcania]
MESKSAIDRDHHATTSEIRGFLRVLLVFTAVLHLLVSSMLVDWFLPFRIGALIGLTAGYLAVLCATYIRRREIADAFLFALVAVWTYWSAFVLIESLDHLLDAVVFIPLGMLFYCAICLGTAYSARWLATRTKFQFTLKYAFIFMTCIALGCVATFQAPTNVLRLLSETLVVFPALIGCFFMAISRRVWGFLAVMFFVFVSLIAIGPILVSELLFVQTLYINLAGAVLVHLFRGEQASTNVKQEAAAN